jgi:hypothetical protein
VTQQCKRLSNIKLFPSDKRLHLKLAAFNSQPQHQNRKSITSSMADNKHWELSLMLNSIDHKTH